MPLARHNLGFAHKLTASAIGEPGSRYFRILVEAIRGTAYLWLEKEQLLQLALAVQELLVLSSSQEPASTEDTEASALIAIEFQVGQIALGQDRTSSNLFLTAYEANQSDTESPMVTFEATREEFSGLAEEAMEVYSAGRPRCPLCGSPSAPEPHTCIRTNGHHARRPFS
jgi:uncharacterized repeat protein (TIGR03847 family)